MKRFLDENEMNTVIALAYEMRQQHGIRLGQAIVNVMRNRGWDFDSYELFYSELPSVVDSFIINYGNKQYDYNPRT